MRALPALGSIGDQHRFLSALVTGKRTPENRGTDGRGRCAGESATWAAPPRASDCRAARLMRRSSGAGDFGDGAPVPSRDGASDLYGRNAELALLSTLLERATTGVG